MNLPNPKPETASTSGVVESLDIKIASAANTGPLAGLTFAVKDMFAVEGHRAGFGSPDWRAGHPPAEANAPAVESLLQAGAHLKANTVCDELAFSLDGINIHYGTPVNPAAPGHIPGGSSSGPASVVAAGLVDFALGTDTAGSTRVPASYCGIWGLRPTHGVISLDGVLPLGPTFDTVGLLCSTLETLKKVSSVFFGENNFEGEKSTTLIVVSEAFALLHPDLQPQVMAALNRVKDCFAACTERTVVDDGLSELVKHFAAIRSVEAWNCHGHWYETTRPNLSPAVEKRLLACRAADPGQATRSRLYRAELAMKFDQLLAGAVLCLPTTAAPPPLITATAEELEANRSLNLQLNSIASFLGLPQLTVPILTVDGTRQPVGLSLIAGRGEEGQLLRLANQV